MNKKINIRNLIIIMLCITIICLGIGFAFLSIELEEKTNEKNTFSVKFSKVQALTPVKGGKNPPFGSSSITNQGSTLTMNLALNAPYDSLAYKVIIKNEGTLKAEIIDLIETPEYTIDDNLKKQLYPVTITHNDIVGKVLEPKEETELKITAIYNQTNQITPKKITYKLNIIAATPEED